MTESLDLDALGAVARAATPGPWTWTSHQTVDVDEWAVFDEREWALASNRDGWSPDAAHIATFNPSTVLALIGRVREAEATIERVREALRDPYKRASLQNALNVLSKVNSALGGDQS